jgi:hypothetical protein
LGILFVLFMSVFAMDVLEENESLGQIAVALIRHLVPAFICLAVLLVAWRWERIGAVLYVVLGVVYLGMAWGRFPLVAYISITGPLVLIGLLFYLHSGRFTVTPTSSVP